MLPPESSLLKIAGVNCESLQAFPLEAIEIVVRLLICPATLTCNGTLHPVGTLAGRVKPMLSRPGQVFDRPAKTGVIDIPPTITLTSKPWARKSNPGGAVASNPAAAPSPVPHAIMTCEAFAGDLWKDWPGTDCVVNPFTSYCVCETTFCASARPLPVA